MASIYTRPHVKLSTTLMNPYYSWGKGRHMFITVKSNFRGLERIGWERRWLGRKPFPEPNRWRLKYPRTEQEDEEFNRYMEESQDINLIWEYFMEWLPGWEEEPPDTWRFEYLTCGYNTDYEWNRFSQRYIDKGIDLVIDAYCAGVPIEDLLPEMF